MNNGAKQWSSWALRRPEADERGGNEPWVTIIEKDDFKARGAFLDQCR